MLSNKEYNVYIDESGDEGINKGSKFFILTAIIVDKEKDLEISKSIDKIKENLEMNIKTQLHWKLLKGLPNKKVSFPLTEGTHKSSLLVCIKRTLQ